ncbi:hypothetical protein BDW59DRAFT_165931 [Aspergillus cavernicola]|uniref:Uncharacterized protein n=1 Tax=Aspergillus cavernicola TaxID=176166 RepID=A0ABR4HPW0_9EURO
MTTEVIDPEGDLVLNCSGVLFLISSTVVSLASTVIRQMLKMENEARFLRRASTDTTKRILRLARANPESCRIFSNVVHHRPDALPRNPDPHCLKHLAYFISDYNCRASLKDRGQAWLLQPLRNRLKEDLWKLLELAYALRLQKNFFEITRQLLSTRLEPFRNWDLAKENLDVLPEAVIGL